ncbi:polysaccharide biosynthesis/export family protein [Novosphingobium terrae]|jgi:polysaccharide biosynthesis/export protein|uniref:polysaccharide biosynthesis/export family protein n=1 Tax=Novosphingobium terrae TaxID=2726189 RepID=UPI0019803FF6|nr:polysaccharide biosynthesis/export family protein [Novosphingobium terrae]
MKTIARLLRSHSRQALTAACLGLVGITALSAPLGASVVRTTVAQLNQDLRAGYQIGAGDHLRITVFDEPTLTNDYIVNESGAVAFPLIDEVPADQLTTSQFAGKLAEKLKAGGYVLTPKVAVEIVKHRPFYILGEVSKPGEYPYTGDLTLAQAVATAGGYTARADTRTIKIQRRSGEQPIQVKLDAPLRIAPGDTIIIKEAFF